MLADRSRDALRWLVVLFDCAVSSQRNGPRRFQRETAGFEVSTVTLPAARNIVKCTHTYDHRMTCCSCPSRVHVGRVRRGNGRRPFGPWPRPTTVLLLHLPAVCSPIMAGRGGPKLKEYRQHVTSVRHWLKEIEYEGLIGQRTATENRGGQGGCNGGGSGRLARRMKIWLQSEQMHSVDAVPLVPLLSPPPPLLTLCRSFFFLLFFRNLSLSFHCSVCEVYCGFFGNCQVILPTINSIMLSIDDSEDKMKWLVINVAKLEEEQRHLLAEEEKKKNDMENVQRRKAANERADESAGQAEEGGAAGGAADGNHHGRAGSLALAGDDEEESQSHARSSAAPARTLSFARTLRGLACWAAVQADAERWRLAL